MQNEVKQLIKEGILLQNKFNDDDQKHKTDIFNNRIYVNGDKKQGFTDYFIYKCIEKNYPSYNKLTGLIVLYNKKYEDIDLSMTGIQYLILSEMQIKKIKFPNTLLKLHFNDNKYVISLDLRNTNVEYVQTDESCKKIIIPYMKPYRSYSKCQLKICRDTIVQMNGKYYEEYYHALDSIDDYEGWNMMCYDPLCENRLRFLQKVKDRQRNIPNNSFTNKFYNNLKYLRQIQRMK